MISDQAPLSMDESSTESSLASSSLVRGPVGRRPSRGSEVAHELQQRSGYPSNPSQNTVRDPVVQLESVELHGVDSVPANVPVEPIHSDDVIAAEAPAQHCGGDDLGFIAPKTMKIVLKGKPFHIAVAPNDDVKLIAAKVPHGFVRVY